MSSSSSREPLAASLPTDASSARGAGASVRRRAAAPDLATVAPGNEGAENDRQHAETGRQQRGTPPRRNENRDAAEHHEADAHHGNGADGKHATRHDPRAVQQQPARGEQLVQAESREIEG